MATFNFVGEGVMDWGALMAVAALIALPPVFITFLGQRWLVAGLTAGAVKEQRHRQARLPEPKPGQRRVHFGSDGALSSRWARGSEGFAPLI